MANDRGPSRADQVAALISALNHLRCARQACDAKQLYGSSDFIAATSAQLRTQLDQLSEEGVSSLLQTKAPL